MIPNDFDPLAHLDEIRNAVTDTQSHISLNSQVLAEFQAEHDNCIFETRDILRQIQEDSIKESRYNRCANFIIITIALLTLVATVVFGLGLL